MIESRLNASDALPKTKSAPLPHDYLQMVTQVFTSNFDAGLKALKKLKAKSKFEANGAVFPNEVILSVSLINEGDISATTAHASADFDPAASSPTVEELLSVCVDAIGSCFVDLLDPKKPERIEKLVSESLSALEDVPFQWTPIEVEARTVYVKLDKTNPSLDKAADEWLAAHDPEVTKAQKEEQTQTEELFFTGPKKKPGNNN